MLLAGCADPTAFAAGPGTTYALDPAKSALFVQVFKDATTLGSDLAHDHVILATGWSGTVRLDPADPTVCEATLSVPVAGLKPDLPDMRKRVGYPVLLTDAQQVQVGDHMRGADQLDAAHFPDIRFSSKTCSGTGPDRVVAGSLSLHGVSKDVKIPLKVSVSPTEISAKGSFSLTHQDFGFAPFTAFLGTLRNQQELRFTLDVVGTAR